MNYYELFHLYFTSNICELLCYNNRFKDYKGFYGIATDLIKKKNYNFCLKVNLTSFHVAFLVFYLHFSPISADLDDLPWIETVPVSSMG